MKTCSYCGTENEAALEACRACGTTLNVLEQTSDSRPFRVLTELSASTLPPANSTASSLFTAIRRALFTCAGIIFVSTAVLMISQRFFFDLQASAHGGPIGKPGIYAVGMLFIPFVILWLLVNLVFSQRICDNRIASRELATLLALLSFILSLLFVWQRDLRSLLPAIILRRSFGLPPGYPGALLQFLLGAFLLGWLQISLRKLRKITPTSPVNTSESQ
jgi:hypothetical protein